MKLIPQTQKCGFCRAPMQRVAYVDQNNERREKYVCLNPNCAYIETSDLLNVLHIIIRVLIFAFTITGVVIFFGAIYAAQ